MKDLGYRLKKTLEVKGMNQSDLARATGISVPAISKYVTNLRIPNASQLQRLCKALGVSSDYLLGIDGDDFERLLVICKTAGLTTEQRMMLVKALSEGTR